MARALHDARLSWWQNEDPLEVFEPGTSCTALVRNDYGYYLAWLATVVRITRAGRVTVRLGTTSETRTLTKEALFAGSEVTRARRERDGPNVEVWKVGPLEKVYRGALRGFEEALGLAPEEVKELRQQVQEKYTAPDFPHDGNTYRVFTLSWGPLETYYHL